MRVMFYVQHLLGIGHLVRASRVASAMADAGQHVTVVTGGMPVEGFPGDTVDAIQLSPMRSADTSFSGLVDQSGRDVDDQWTVPAVRVSAGNGKVKLTSQREHALIDLHGKLLCFGAR